MTARRAPRCTLVTLLSLVGLLLSGAAPAGTQLEDEHQKDLYFLGVALANYITPFRLTPEELETVKLGLTEAIKGEATELDPQVYGQRLQTLQQQRVAVSLAEEQKLAEAFLSEQAGLPGATTLESGLIMTELAPGTGESPTAADQVRVHYVGTLRNGTEFDSSFSRGEPAEFPLGGVIPCWTEGLSKMKVGGKSRLVCPASIAYGDRGAPPAIPGGAALMFEVELLEIVKATEKATE
jgi:FKBP-type peptidyl-prolyl cis-trans isomerase FkpA